MHQSFRDVCGDVPREYVARGALTVCNRLCAILHRYYVIQQWHRDPFARENHDVAYLHRPNGRGHDAVQVEGGSENEKSDDADAGVKAASSAAEGGTPPIVELAAGGAEESGDGAEKEKVVDDDASAWELEEAEIMRASERCVAQLEPVSKAMHEGQRVLFQQVQARFGSYLDFALFSSTSPLKAAATSRTATTDERERELMRTDHLLDLQHWAEIRALCGMLIKVGGIFCRAPKGEEATGGRVSSHVLGKSMINIERRYFRTFNGANCRRMRDALSRDDWRPLSSESIFAHGGLRGVLKLQSLGFGGKASAVMEAATAIMLSSNGGGGAETGDRSAEKEKEEAQEEGDEEKTGETEKLTLESMNVLELFALRGNPFSDDFFELLTNEMEATEGASHDVVVDETDWSSLIVTSTTCNCFAKLVRRYVQLMIVMPQVTGLAFQGLTQLWDLYLYAVMTSFTTPAARNLLLATDRRVFTLKEQLVRIKKEMGITTASSRNSTAQSAQSDSGSGAAGGDATVELNFPSIISESSLSDMVDLVSQASMRGVAVRSVAVESLKFLTLVLEAVQPTVVELIAGNPKFAKTHTEFCAAFFKRAPSIVDQALYLMYSSTPATVYNPLAFVQRSIASTPWNRSSPPEESNAYVKTLVAELKDIWNKLEALRNVGCDSDATPLPRASQEVLWVHFTARCAECLLEGFSSVRTCSIAGRGLMAMDLTALYRGVRNVHPLDPEIVAAEHPLTPRYGQSYVGAYINAYYEEEEGELLTWIQQNVNQYRASQFETLIQCGVGRKMKKKKLKMLQELVASMCK